jgi:hypothetical protein
MTAPVVVIELAGPDRASPFVATLIEACSRASLEGTCALADASGSDAAPALAILGWQDEHRTARVEVGLRRTDHAEWLTRRIEFRSEDREVERWRTTGLVIATLAGDARAGVTERTEAGSAPPGPSVATPKASGTPPRPPSPAATPAPLKTRVSKPTAPPTEETRRGAWSPPERLWIDLGPALGSGLDHGGPRLGAFVAGAYPFPRTPLFARVALHFDARPFAADNLKLVWGSAGLGLGMVLAPTSIPFRFDVRGEVSGELAYASTTDASGSSDGGSRLSVGARVGGDVAWMPMSTLGLVVGGEATFASGTTLRVHDEAVARQAPVGYSLLLGARVSVP